MPTLIHERVRLAREGRNPYVIARLESGWVVAGDVQPLPGYCLLLPDPVVGSLNTLPEDLRALYGRDVARVGDALLHVTGAHRVNYETWGNAEEALHTHIVPRYAYEPESKRRLPACVAYDWSSARPFHPADDRPFVDALKAFLERPTAAQETDILRSLYAALNRGDTPGVVRLFDAEAVRVEFEGTPAEGTYRGLAALEAHIAKARATWADGSCDPVRFAVAGERLIAFVHVRVRLKDAATWLEGHTADVFTFRDGKIVEMRTFASAQDASAWTGHEETPRLFAGPPSASTLATAEATSAPAGSGERPLPTLAQTPEPPYYAVVFSSLRADGIDSPLENPQDGYADTAERMLALASRQDGFLGVDSARSGVGLTVSYWRDLASIAAWRSDAEHAEARRRGREEWYADFHVRIARVEKAYAKGR